MMLILTEVCQILRNWFDRDQKKWFGKVTINNGEISLTPEYNLYNNEVFSLTENQYYRIIGSLFNDGVHRYLDNDLVDETFTGAIWAMAVPPSVIALCDDIQQWQNKYGAIDGQAMSPYSSESFGGYSYSKSGGSSSTGGSNGAAVTWKDIFAQRLNQWRKI